MSPYNRAFKRAAVLSSLIATAIPALADDPISIRGYIDTSFNYQTGPAGSKGSQVSFTNGTPTRVFDQQGNGFRLQQASLFLSAAPAAGWGGMVNITAGQDADLIHSYGEFGATTGNTFVDLTQAYISYAHGPVTLIGGKFVTLSGQEVIDSANNWNFDRSILFGYAIPFTHTGLRATVAAGKLSFSAGVNNGWDQMTDANKSKTFEGSVTLTANDKLSLEGTVYSGQEPTASGNGNRTLVDGLLTYKVSPKTTVVVNGDYGTQGNAATSTPTANNTAIWRGVAAYVHHDVNDKWGVTLRGETFGDRDGYRTGIPQWWSEQTLTVHYKPNASHEFKVEVRHDHTTGQSFTNSDGTTGSSFTTYGVQWIYKF